MAAPSCSWRAMVVRRSMSLSARVSPACTHVQQQAEQMHSTQRSGLSPAVKGMHLCSQPYPLQLAIARLHVASPQRVRRFTACLQHSGLFPCSKCPAKCRTGLLDGTIDPSVRQPTSTMRRAGSGSVAIIWELALRARRKASAFTAVPSGPWANGLPVLMPASCCAGALCISSRRSPSLRPAAAKVPLQQQIMKMGWECNL